MELYGKNYDPTELTGYISDFEAIGGFLPFEFTDGRARGMRGLQVTNATGLRYIILPDRALDISSAFLGPYAFGWRSRHGESHPGLGDTTPHSFLPIYGGGLLVTCGLENFGAAGSIDGRAYPMHGSLHREPAQEVAWTKETAGDGLELVVRGLIRQSSFLDFHFVVEREYRTPFTRNEIHLTDRITNRSAAPMPLMLLYHWNFGFPLVAPGARIDADIEKTEPRDADAEFDAARALEIDPPSHRPEQTYFHTLRPDADGLGRVRLVNPALNENRGLAVEMTYPHALLPFLTEWKCMHHGNYVIGLEPSTAPLLGRALMHERGIAPPMLGPGETRTFTVTLQIG